MPDDLRKSILILHQDQERLKKLRRLLAREGFDILTAPNEMVAGKLFGELEIDMVICQPQFTKLPDKTKP